jgi:hypothetical protein
MVAQQDNQTNRKEGRGALVACLVLFAAYFINVLVGKINISFDQNLPHFGNVAEFLMLTGACILLIIAALKRETAEKILLTQTERGEENGE